MAITNLAGRYLQDSFKFVTQNSQSYTSPDMWDFADGEAVPITWINATASWAATASVALGLADNIWIRSTGNNSAVLNDSGSKISYAEGTSSIAYGYRTTASGDFSQAQGTGSVSIGEYSHAEGALVTASALASHAEGYKTVAGTSTLVSPAIPPSYTTVNFKNVVNVRDELDQIALKATPSIWVPLSNNWITIFTNGYNQSQYTTATVSGKTVYYPQVGSAYSMSMRLSPLAGPVELIDIQAIYVGLNAASQNGYWLIPKTPLATVGYLAVEAITSNPLIPFQEVATAFNPFVPAVYAYSGSFSHTEGWGTKTLGTASHAEGIYTTASGDYSHAEGSASISYGIASHAEGLHTIASGNFQTVVGRYNTYGNTDDYFVVGDGVDTRPVSRSNALGVNATRFYASNSIYFPDLSESFKQHLVVFDTASKQIFYYTASGLGGGGTPGGPNGAIQFNSASTFSGSGLLTYNFNNSQIVLTGSQIIDLSGSSTALQITNDCSGQSSTLTGLPYLHLGIYGYKGPGLTTLWVPSGSYGQIWSLSVDTPVYVYDITSSNGDLQFRGAIGKPFPTNNSPGYGRLSNDGIYAGNLNKIIIGSAQGFGGTREISTTVYAYSSSVIGAQPLGFTSSTLPVDLAYDNSLYEYTCSLIAGDGSGITSFDPPGNNDPQWVSFGPYRKFAYTPSGSGASKVHYYTFASHFSASKGDPNFTIRPGTALSASYAAWVVAGSNTLAKQSVGDQLPIGFFMSTYEKTNPATQSIEISTAISESGINTNRFVQYDGRPGRPMVPAEATAPLYNPITERLYILVKLPGSSFLPSIPSNTLAICELDLKQTPPIVTNVSDMYVNPAVRIPSGDTFAGWALDTGSGDLIISSKIGTTSLKFFVYDATATNIQFSSSTALKASYTIPFYSSLGSILPASSSFYMVGNSYAGTTNASHPLSFLRIESSSAGYTFMSNSYATSYHGGVSYLYQGTSFPTYAQSINKIFTVDQSDIGPVGESHTVDEVPPITYASAHKVYSLDTGSLALSATFNPYTATVNRVGNFVEFIDCAGEVLSYVDANGVFQGTASFASNVLPGGSSIEFYSGSVLQTSNLEGLVISGSYLNSQANGNQVTMSLDLSSLLATFTSQSFGSSLTWTFNHNLNEWHPLVTVYDINHEVIIPQTIDAINANTLQITFSSPESGYAVAGAGPFTGLTRYPISFYSSSTLQSSDLRSLVITGSGVTSTVNGTQVTMSFSGGGGSANPGGSNTTIQFNYNGNALSGSNNFTFVSQSNFVYLTGSMNVSSGSITLSGSAFITGSLNTTGSVFLRGLTDTSYPHVVGFNTASGQLNYFSTGAFDVAISSSGTGLTRDVRSIDFTGTGIITTQVNNNVTVTVPGPNPEKNLIIATNSSYLDGWSDNRFYVGNTDSGWASGQWNVTSGGSTVTPSLGTLPSTEDYTCGHILPFEVKGDSIVRVCGVVSDINNATEDFYVAIGFLTGSDINGSPGNTTIHMFNQLSPHTFTLDSRGVGAFAVSGSAPVTLDPCTSAIYVGFASDVPQNTSKFKFTYTIKEVIV